MSMPIFDLGRSSTWPTLAFTVKPESRYFLMVLALAGDSTTTSVPVPPCPSAAAADAALRVLRAAAFFLAGFFVALDFVAMGPLGRRTASIDARPMDGRESQRRRKYFPGCWAQRPLISRSRSLARAVAADTLAFTAI